MAETRTDSRSSSRKCIGFESNSVLVWAKMEIAALVVAVIAIPSLLSLPWHNWSCRHFAARAFDAEQLSRETSAPLLPQSKFPEFVQFLRLSVLLNG